MKSKTEDAKETPMTLDEALASFLLQLQADGRSRHTWKQYERHVRFFRNWISETESKSSLDEIRHEDLARFIASETTRIGAQGHPRSAATLNALRTSLRCFFEFCHAAEWSSHNPARLLCRARTRPKDPRPVGRRDQERLLKAAAEPKSFEETRDLMLLKLLLGAGLRIGSAIALDLEDVDLEAAELRIRKQKGGGESYALLPAVFVDELRAFLQGRTTGPLFHDRLGRRITIRQAQRRFAALLEKAGIGRMHSLHSLRHSFATRLYERTGDIHLVQEALNHRHIESTLVYARCDRERLRSAL